MQLLIGHGQVPTIMPEASFLFGIFPTAHIPVSDFGPLARPAITQCALRKYAVFCSAYFRRKCAVIELRYMTKSRIWDMLSHTRFMSIPNFKFL